MRKTLLLLYIIFQVFLSSVNAQSNYPLYVMPALTPPYTLNLSDYSQFGSQKLMITIHANDLNISNLPVKLQIKLETMGVSVENPPTLVTTPIFINGGETNVLFGTDLADYFNINNLIFKGYSKETYKRTGQLPEGFYKFTVQVLHFNSNRLISNLGTSTAWITIGKPPVLKSPENNAQMGKFKGMPLTFTWLSSNVGSPISANTIQYKFEMWEMHVPGINPNTIAVSSPVFHEQTLFNTVYTLYPNSLLMTPGMQYAWRVTASDLSGFVPFEQNGRSEIRTFIYKAACDSITNLSSTHRARNGVFSWNPKNNHTSFNIELRNPKTTWMANSESYENKAEFYDLEYGTTYEMRVQAVCDGDPESKSDFSTWKKLSIPVPAPKDTADCPDCECDDQIPDTELQNFELRNDLQAGDTIINKTGTTRFIVKTAESQGNGTYKGIFLFWAEIWKLKFICNYWDLQVNTDNVIVNMDFESVYDPQFLIDVDSTIGYLDSLAEIITTLTTDITPDDTLIFNGTITTIYVNSGDSVIAVTVDEFGNTTEIVISDNVDDIEETLIQGENGEEYVITRNGEVMGLDEYKNTGGGRGSDIDTYNEEKEKKNLSDQITVNFTASPNQKYGFDQYSDEKSALQSKYPSLNNGYRPAYKSIASFSNDLVGVSNSGEKIIFKDEMGIPLIKTGQDLNIRGSVNGSDVALYAYEVVNDTTEKIAGKLNILSFDEQAKKLYIVSVNGAAMPNEIALQETLNKIYGQAVTRWQVTKQGDLKDIVFENGNMTHGGTSAISVYNKDQRTIVNSFEESINSKLEKNAYYLFFVENVQFKDRSIAGYMPLQRQVGFIYDNPNANIIAHELSHGAFNLYHTFSPEGFIAAEHSTENLMDYKGGTDLWKHQWNLVQSPDKMLFAWLQDESEGEMIYDEIDCIIDDNSLTDESNLFKDEERIELKNIINRFQNYSSINLFLISPDISKPEEEIFRTSFTWENCKEKGIVIVANSKYVNEVDPNWKENLQLNRSNKNDDFPTSSNINQSKYEFIREFNANRNVKTAIGKTIDKLLFDFVSKDKFYIKKNLKKYYDEEAITFSESETGDVEYEVKLDDVFNIDNSKFKLEGKYNSDVFELKKIDINDNNSKIILKVKLDKLKPIESANVKINFDDIRSISFLFTFCESLFGESERHLYGYDTDGEDNYSVKGHFILLKQNGKSYFDLKSKCFDNIEFEFDKQHINNITEVDRINNRVRTFEINTKDVNVDQLTEIKVKPKGSSSYLSILKGYIIPEGEMNFTIHDNTGLSDNDFKNLEGNVKKIMEKIIIKASVKKQALKFNDINGDGKINYFVDFNYSDINNYELAELGIPYSFEEVILADNVSKAFLLKNDASIGDSKIALRYNNISPTAYKIWNPVDKKNEIIYLNGKKEEEFVEKYNVSIESALEETYYSRDKLLTSEKVTLLKEVKNNDEKIYINLNKDKVKEESEFYFKITKDGKEEIKFVTIKKFEQYMSDPTKSVMFLSTPIQLDNKINESDIIYFLKEQDLGFKIKKEKKNFQYIKKDQKIIFSPDEIYFVKKDDKKEQLIIIKNDPVYTENLVVHLALKVSNSSSSSSFVEASLENKYTVDNDIKKSSYITSVTQQEFEAIYPSHPSLNFIQGFTLTGAGGPIFLTSGSLAGYRLVHELGHSYYGFGHVTETDNIMYPSASGFSTSKILKLPFNMDNVQWMNIAYKRRLKYNK